MGPRGLCLLLALAAGCGEIIGTTDGTPVTPYQPTGQRDASTPLVPEPVQTVDATVDAAVEAEASAPPPQPSKSCVITGAPTDATFAYEPTPPTVDQSFSVIATGGNVGWTNVEIRLCKPTSGAQATTNSSASVVASNPFKWQFDGNKIPAGYTQISLWSDKNNQPGNGKDVRGVATVLAE